MRISILKVLNHLNYDHVIYSIYLHFLKLLSSMFYNFFAHNYFNLSISILCSIKCISRHFIHIWMNIYEMALLSKLVSNCPWLACRYTLVFFIFTLNLTVLMKSLFLFFSWYFLHRWPYQWKLNTVLLILFLFVFYFFLLPPCFDKTPSTMSNLISGESIPSLFPFLSVKFHFIYY